jgi:hypothetical protein
MNALINSQFEEFKRYQENYEKATGKSFPVSFGQYTGQEKEEVRERMRENPPHVLLTNYMMLELLLTRTAERRIRDSVYANLKYLVFDELHTYRGRQGADVAMLIRRIQAQCAETLLCIGTSATMASGDDLEHQKVQIAAVATLLFGRKFLTKWCLSHWLVRWQMVTQYLPRPRSVPRSNRASTLRPVWRTSKQTRSASGLRIA